ncbi:hypothetical protein Hanom_Chr03g00210161 [Helianthus anomalus]
MESRFKDTQADLKALKTQILHTSCTAPPPVFFIDHLPKDNAKKGEKIQEWRRKGITDGLYLAPENSNMTKQIPLPDGSKKIDVTTNALAEARACVKRDREAKKKAMVDYPDQGTSGLRDGENLVDEKKKPTRRVRLPKSIPVRRSKSTKKPPPKTAVVTPVVSTAAGTSVVSISAPTSTHTTSTYTTSTALPPSPPKSKSPPAKRQKTTVVKTSVVKTTVVGTQVVSTTVSLSQKLPLQPPFHPKHHQSLLK